MAISGPSSKPPKARTFVARQVSNADQSNLLLNSFKPIFLDMDFSASHKKAKPEVIESKEEDYVMVALSHSNKVNTEILVDKLFKMRKMLFESSDHHSEFYKYIKNNPTLEAKLGKISNQIKRAMSVHIKNGGYIYFAYKKQDEKTVCIFTEYLEAIEQLYKKEDKAPLVHFFEAKETIPLFNVLKDNRKILKEISRSFLENLEAREAKLESRRKAGMKV